jgi:hypothetical protein
MIDSPTPNNVPVIAEPVAPEYTNCDSGIAHARATGCKSCSNMVEDMGVTRCQLLALDINLIISANEIICPEGVW